MPLIEGGYDLYNHSASLGGAIPGGANAGRPFRQSIDRRFANADLAGLTTQVMTSVAMHLEVGEVVSKIAFCSGGTAAGTPTNWWFALYSNAGTPALLAQTADQTSGAWAADTVKDLALATAQTISTTGIYYCAVMVKATTVPTLMGTLQGGNASRVGLAGAFVTGAKVLAQTSGSSLTATAPATIASPTSVATIPWCLVH